MQPFPHFSHSMPSKSRDLSLFECPRGFISVTLGGVGLLQGGLTSVSQNPLQGCQ